MASKLVRCIEGHVFDRGEHATCPICGSSIPKAAGVEESQDRIIEEAPAAAPVDETNADPKRTARPARSVAAAMGTGRRRVAVAAAAGAAGAKAARLCLRFVANLAATTIRAVSALPRRLQLAGIASVVVIVVALVYFLRPPVPPPTPAPHQEATTQSSAPQTQASAPAPAATSPPVSAPVVANPPAPAPQPPPPQPQPPPAPSQTTELSPTLKAALAITRMYEAAFPANPLQRDSAVAIKFATDLVEANNPRGGLMLGRLYEYGVGFAQDPAKAREYYTWAVTRGDADAALELARLWERGIGGAADRKNAEELYEYAAANAVPGAAAALSGIKPNGVTAMPTVVGAYNDIFAGRNTQQAMQFLDAMLKKGSGLANCAVGTLYLNGKGVNQDPNKASQFYRSGAARGYTWCASGMAQFATSGAPAIPKDLIEAEVWYAYTCTFGNLGPQMAEMDQNVKKLMQQMSPGQVQQGGAIIAAYHLGSCSPKPAPPASTSTDSDQVSPGRVAWEYGESAAPGSSSSLPFVQYIGPSDHGFTLGAQCYGEPSIQITVDHPDPALRQLRFDIPIPVTIRLVSEVPNMPSLIDAVAASALLIEGYSENTGRVKVGIAASRGATSIVNLLGRGIGARPAHAIIDAGNASGTLSMTGARDAFVRFASSCRMPVPPGFRLSAAEESKELAFCKSLPRPSGVSPEVRIDDYCGCWIGTAQSLWNQEEYAQWKAAAQGQNAMSPSLGAKVSSAVRQCVSAGTQAK